MDSGPIQILIIDDERLNSIILQGMLEPEGYHILTAENGIIGREIAGRETPDLILLDILMPGEDGFVTCKKLKKNPGTADIPIIFISALDDTDSKVRGLTIGGWDYITKPFQREEVIARVKNYLKLSLSFKRVILEQAKRLKQIHDAQQAILVKPEDVPEIRFGVFYNARLEAGGDFYDVFQISDYVHDFFISDISGHDIGASFATSALKALVRQNASLVYSPAETIKTINNVLSTLFQNGQHLTAVYLRLDRKKNLITVVNAAHCPVILLRQSGKIQTIESTGSVVGSFTDSFYEEEVLSVEAGDKFFLYTDGIVESFINKPQSRDVGYDQLEQVIRKFSSLPVDQIVREVAAVMINPGEIAEDDVVLLGAEV